MTRNNKSLSSNECNRNKENNMKNQCVKELGLINKIDRLKQIKEIKRWTKLTET